MGSTDYAGSEKKTSWKFWRHPALYGLGQWDVAVSREGAVLSRSTKSGFHLGAWYVAFTASDCEGQMLEILARAEVIMRRREKVSEGIAKTPHADGTELLEQFPTLAGWFTDPTFDDGTDRKGGWVGLSCRDGLWALLMKDDGEGLQITISAPSLLALLSLAEHALTAPEAPWRHDPKAKVLKPGKK